jgi:hypothetical protein
MLILSCQNNITCDKILCGMAMIGYFLGVNISKYEYNAAVNRNTASCAADYYIAGETDA